MEENEEIGGSRPMCYRVVHVKKIALKSKALSVSFNEKDLKDFITGFHRKKKKRRKEPQQKLQEVERQKRTEAGKKNILWTPSKVISRLGKEINDESSFLYWAYKNNIPVFYPSLTDGSLGDMLCFHYFRNPGLVVDIVQDIRRMNGKTVHAGLRKTGMIILGGGLPKHHICNANMMRNGADFAVFINTAQEYNGSDSGARPNEAISWGKIRDSARTVKDICFSSLVDSLTMATRSGSKGSLDKQNKAYILFYALCSI